MISTPVQDTEPDRSVADWETAELLASLVDKSLVLFDGAGRWRMLESVRAYCRQLLDNAGDGGDFRDRHLRYFLDFSREAETNLILPGQAEWLESLDDELDNVRAALIWSLTADPEAGLQISGSLLRFWDMRGHYAEGRTRLADLLDAATPPIPSHARAAALNAAGALALRQGDYQAARPHFEESLSIRRELGDRRGIAASLNNLSLLSSEGGDFATGRVLLEESLAILRDLGNPSGVAMSLNNLGNLTYLQGDFDAARALYEESLEIKRSLGDKRGLASALNNLGMVVCDQGDHRRARVLIQESLQIDREVGDRRSMAGSLNNLGMVAYEEGDYASSRSLYAESLAIRHEYGDLYGMVYSLEGIAAAGAAQGRPEPAVHLWGAAERLREEIGAPLPPNERTKYETRVAAARAALGDEAFAAGWARGRALTVDQAAVEGLSDRK